MVSFLKTGSWIIILTDSKIASKGITAMDKEKLGWESFALLLIDLQQDFWSERLAEGYPEFPSKVSELLGVCRGTGIEVIHLRSVFKVDSSNWMPIYKLRGSIPCLEGTTGVETLPFALEEEGEQIFLKQTFDGFQNPQLFPYLQSGQKRFILIAGLVTSICVFLTTASAMQHGFLTAIVEDSCADRPSVHDGTLNTYSFMFDRVGVNSITERHRRWMDSIQRLSVDL
jgi:nicotinamidase-related amidase